MSKKFLLYVSKVTIFHHKCSLDFTIKLQIYKKKSCDFIFKNFPQEKRKLLLYVQKLLMFLSNDFMRRKVVI